MKPMVRVIYCLLVNSICASKNSTLLDLNVVGSSLEICSLNPLTGWYRDGYCRTDSNDHGVHVVCATMTQSFLVSPRGEAMMEGYAPLVNIKATHEATLKINNINELMMN